MNGVTANLTDAVASEALRSLADGVDAQKADEFLDQLLHVAERLGNVSCALANDRALRLQSHNVMAEEAHIERAKSTLRMVCARLAVRCGEWAKRKFSPYGDLVQFELPPTMNVVVIRFANTTALQQIDITIQSANGSPASV